MGFGAPSEVSFAAAMGMKDTGSCGQVFRNLGGGIAGPSVPAAIGVAAGCWPPLVCHRVALAAVAAGLLDAAVSRSHPASGADEGVFPFEWRLHFPGVCDKDAARRV